MVTLSGSAAVALCKIAADSDLFLAHGQFYTADASVVHRRAAYLQWLWLLKAQPVESCRLIGLNGGRGDVCWQGCTAPEDPSASERKPWSVGHEEEPEREFLLPWLSPLCVQPSGPAAANSIVLPGPSPNGSQKTPCAPYTYLFQEHKIRSVLRIETRGGRPTRARGPTETRQEHRWPVPKS